jgi:hypothetical protein
MLGALLLCSLVGKAQTSSGEGFSETVSPKSGASKESKWFIRAYSSYGLPIASSYRPGNSTSKQVAANTYENTINRKGLGQGWHVGGGIGYILNENINLGIDVDQYWSGKITSTNQSGYFNIYPISEGRVDTSFSSTFSSQRIEAKMLSVTPNITFKAISRPDFYIYNRLGITIGVRNELTQYQRDSSATSYIYNGRKTNVSENTYEYKGGIPLGFQASLGVHIRLTQSIRFFAEAQFTHLTYSPKKRILTQSFVNGNDRLLEEDLTPLNERETHYVDTYTKNYQKTDKDKATEQTKIRIPYTSVGLSAGLAYRF